MPDITSAGPSFRFNPREVVGYADVTIPKLASYLVSLGKHNKHKVACRTARISADKVDALYEEGLKLLNTPHVVAHYGDDHPIIRDKWDDAKFIDAVENPDSPYLTTEERQQVKAMWFAQQRETLPGTLQEQLLDKLRVLTLTETDPLESPSVVRGRDNQIKHITKLLEIIGVEGMSPARGNAGTTLNLTLGDRTYNILAGRMESQEYPEIIDVTPDGETARKNRKAIKLDI